jgi:alpha-L-rhamnosidase
MRESHLPAPVLRRSSGLANAPSLEGGKPFTIPANSTVSLLFDQQANSVAYPEMTVSGGMGAQVKLTYAEALFAKDRSKGNRNEIEGKEMIGNFDVFLPDGGKDRTFRPLWFRTWRYLQLDITTGAEPLVFEGLKGMTTGYPFEQKASFSSSDPSLQKIWDIGWRTALNCAGENYFDCPYYEQLQYEGDTRIQSLISLYVAGDDRLMRKAILDFYHSRVPEGLTQGRYPSNRLQVIPPFSLYWVSMIHDHWMHRQDDAFLSQFLVGITGVLDWFERRVDHGRNMLGPLTWWNFADWNLAFENGVPDGSTDGNSSVITLQYVYTLRQAAELFEHFGKKDEAAHYLMLANELAKGTYKQCFDPARGLMANTPEKKAYSQHASIMGVLSGSIPAQDRRSVMNKVLEDASLSQATFYYRFYLTRALKYAGMADLYYAQLKPWRGMIDNGLTTFAEQPDPTRSDCHAWSSSPNYDFLATICGINPSSPGFRTVRIEPALGELSEVKGSMPHPEGTISVHLIQKGSAGVEAEISLPEKVTGEFVWKGKSSVLHPGYQKIIF